MFLKREIFVRICELEDSLFDLEVRLENLEDQLEKLKKVKRNAKGKK